MKKNIQLLTAATAVAVLISVSSCKKKDDVTGTPAAATPTGTLAFHLHTNVDTNEVDTFGATYVLTGGRKITLNVAQCYVSNIMLVGVSGSMTAVPNVVKFKRQQNEVYTIGSVPVGNYTSVMFDIGLGATANATAPVTTDTILYQPGMAAMGMIPAMPTTWFSNPWGASTGYIFLSLQGTIDTTTAGNGTNMIPFSYNIGTSANSETITMPNQNFSVTANQVTFVHMIIDYYKLFNGIKLNDPNNLQMNTTADNTTALGIQLAHNIQSMVSYEQ